MGKVINGTDLFVYANSTGFAAGNASGATAIAHATSHTLSFKMTTRDTSDKTSGTWLTRAPGRMDVTITAEGLCAYGEFEALANNMINQTGYAIWLTQYGTPVSGVAPSGYASGVFYVTSWEHTAGQEENATYSVTFEHCSGFNFVTGMTEA